MAVRYEPTTTSVYDGDNYYFSVLYVRILILFVYCYPYWTSSSEAARRGCLSSC